VGGRKEEDKNMEEKELEGHPDAVEVAYNGLEQAESSILEVGCW
jgi:hypothetical protein